MAQVPYTGSPTNSPSGVQPETTAPTADYVHVEMPNLNLKAPQVERLGATIGQGGNELFAHAQALQGIHNELNADDARNQFSQAMAQSEAQFREKYQGKAAQDHVNEQIAAQHALFAQYRDSLSNPQAQQFFAQSASRLLDYRGDALFGYAAGEFRNAVKQTAAANVAIALDNGTGMAMNPERRAEAEQSVLGEVQKQGEVEQWGPEVIKAQQSRALGELYGGTIERMIASGQAGDAQALFNDVGSKMDAAHASQVALRLRTAVTEQEGGALGRWAAGDGPDIRGTNTGYANNLGNIKSGGQAFEGEAGGYGQFRTFDTPEHGASAMVQLLRRYNDQQPGITLQAAIAKWAPPSENDTTSYVAAVARAAHLDPNAPLPLNDPHAMANLTYAMARHEKGAGMSVPPSVFESAADHVISGAPLRQTTPVSAAAAVAPRNVSEAVAAIEKRTDITPEVKDRAISEATRIFAERDRANADLRSQLATQLNDGMSALEAGHSFSWDEAQIRSYFDKPGEADRMIRNLNDAKTFGTTMGALNGMTRQQINDKTAELEKGLQSPDTTNFAFRQQIAGQWQRAVQAHDQQLLNDPADFVARSSGTVQRAIALANPEDPASMQNVARASLAEQARVGLDPSQMRVLTRQQAQQIAQKFQSADPSKVDVGAQIQGLRQTYGQYFNRAWGDLVSSGKLSSDWQVLGMINDPVSRTNYQSALQFAATKGGAKEVEAELAPGAMKDVRDAVQGAMTDFAKSARVNGAAQNDSMIGMVRDGITLMATRNVLNGASPAQAVERARDAILGRYDFLPNGLDSSVVMRLPAGQGDQIRDYAARAQATLTANDVAPMAADIPNATPAQQRQHAADAAHSGVWMTNEGDDGLVLLGKLVGGGYAPIRRTDGSRIEVKFRDAMRGTATLPDAPPTDLPAGRLN